MQLILNSNYFSLRLILTQSLISIYHLLEAGSFTITSFQLRQHSYTAFKSNLNLAFSLVQAFQTPNKYKHV